ncbi:MAG: HAMP domain-containing sensor histidine kinase [Tepidiformaceae bacterium]
MVNERSSVPQAARGLATTNTAESSAGKTGATTALEFSPSERAQESESTTREQSYSSLLRSYCEFGSEEALYRASLLSQDFISAGVAPDEIVAIHTEAVQEVVKAFDPRSLVASQQFLLEVMIAFGVRYTEYAEFRLAEAKQTVEREHVRADTATRAEQERLELLAVISHELGTPLTVAKGNVAAIRRFLGENNRLTHDLSVRAIDAESAIERLLALREELVAASQNEVRTLELAPLNIESAITRAVKWAAVAADEKSLSLGCEFAARRNRVVADPDALQSILGNLLSNAVRYTPAGGKVSISTRNVGDDVLVEVTDTGIGLSEDAKERLFERFYRAPEAKKLASWGLGLGLVIANELAESLGATITGTGEPGVGSTFVVRFPCAGAEEE